MDLARIGNNTVAYFNRVHRSTGRETPGSQMVELSLQFKTPIRRNRGIGSSVRQWIGCNYGCTCYDVLTVLYLATNAQKKSWNAFD